MNFIGCKKNLWKIFPIHFQSSKHISQLKHDLALSLLTYSTPWLETFSSSSQVTSERVAAEFEEIQNMSKLKAAAAEKERKLFLRHALERRKNVSKQNKSAKFPTDTLDTRSLSVSKLKKVYLNIFLDKASQVKIF